MIIARVVVVAVVSAETKIEIVITTTVLLQAAGTEMVEMENLRQPKSQKLKILTNATVRQRGKSKATKRITRRVKSTKILAPKLTRNPSNQHRLAVAEVPQTAATTFTKAIVSLTCWLLNEDLSEINKPKTQSTLIFD